MGGASDGPAPGLALELEVLEALDARVDLRRGPYLRAVWIIVIIIVAVVAGVVGGGVGGVGGVGCTR